MLAAQPASARVCQGVTVITDQLDLASDTDSESDGGRTSRPYPGLRVSVLATVTLRLSLSAGHCAATLLAARLGAGRSA